MVDRFDWSGVLVGFDQLMDWLGDRPVRVVRLVCRLVSSGYVVGWADSWLVGRLGLVGLSANFGWSVLLGRL